MKQSTKQIKICSKNKSKTRLIITKTDFQDEVFPLELCSTARQKAKLRNRFTSNRQRDIKLSKAQ